MRFGCVGDVCVDDYESLGKAYIGGNPINVAVYLTRNGEEASFCGAVGTDDFGCRVYEALMKKGIDTSHLKTLEGNTAITKVEMVNGNRVFGDYTEGVLTDFKLTGDDIDYLCGHDIVITGIWGMIENELPLIKAQGIPIAFDFSDQLEHEIVDIAIPFVDYAFFSNEDGDTMKLRDYIKKQYARGPKIIVVTMGNKGSLAYDGNEFYKQGIVACPVVDTMGAGDSFIAGFLGALMHGKSISECMENGAKTSAVTIGYSGAW